MNWTTKTFETHAQLTNKLGGELVTKISILLKNQLAISLPGKTSSKTILELSQALRNITEVTAPPESEEKE